MLDHTDNSCNLSFSRKHKKLKPLFDIYTKEIQILQLEVFNYIEGILKKYKPTNQ